MLLIILQIIFWGLIFLAVHSYLIYPIVIFISSLICKSRIIKNSKTEFTLPSVSILISAFNEEKVIEERIKNISCLNYDFKKIEVLVGSDGSNDKTNEILLALHKKYAWLKIFLFPKQRGKASVLNNLFDKSKNKIILFTDANTEFDKNALFVLVKKFNNENIGGVCGRLILSDNLVPDNESVEEKKYWVYETFIKNSEGKCGVLIGSNGGIFAIKKEFVTKIPIDKPVTDDLYLTLSVLAQGKKFVYDYDAIAYEDVGKNVSIEFSRKIRFAATNFQIIPFFKSLLFNKNFLLSYAYWSHKIIRWFFPILLTLIFILNLCLYKHGEIYQIIFYLQLGIYSFALVGYVLHKIKVRMDIFAMPFFFVLSNIALVIGLIKFLRNRHSIIWESTER